MAINNFPTPSHLTTTILTILFLSLSSCPTILTTAVCTDELVSFSSCLPYTSSPPNNSSSSPSANCCDKFSDIVVSGNGFCLCYLIEQPMMLGFPLNAFRIFSLSSVCPPSNNATSKRILSLQSICTAFEAPPPAQSPGPSSQNHSDSSEPATSPAVPPMIMDTTPISDGDSPPDFDTDSLQASSATKIKSSCNWLLPKRFPPRPVFSSTALAYF